MSYPDVDSTVAGSAWWAAEVGRLAVAGEASKHQRLDRLANRTAPPMPSWSRPRSLADLLAVLPRELLAAQDEPSLLIGPTLDELLAAQITTPLPAA
jgi:hypothetical protein